MEGTLERWNDGTMLWLLLLLNFSLARTGLALIFRNMMSFYSRRLGFLENDGRDAGTMERWNDVVVVVVVEFLACENRFSSNFPEYYEFL
jgi:hypothetical protein